MVTTNKRIKLRRGIADRWQTQDPTLASGEVGFVTDTGSTRTGDGSTAWITSGDELVPEVSAFPAYAPGARVFHTGIGLTFYNDGTNWYSTRLFQQTLHGLISFQSSTTVTTYVPVPFKDSYDLLIESVEYTAFLDASSANWTMALEWATTGNVYTVFSSVTMNQTGSTFDTQIDSSPSQLGATAVVLALRCTENSGTANIFPGAIVNYRVKGA